MPTRNDRPSSQPAQPATRRLEPLPNELIEKILDRQKDEVQLSLKRIEIDAQRISIDAQHEENSRFIAQASIEAEERDRKDERGHIERRTKLLFIGSTVIIVAVLIFCGFALSIGKEAIVAKFAEIGVIFAAGFASGWGVKTAKSANKKDDNS